MCVYRNKDLSHQAGALRNLCMRELQQMQTYDRLMTQYFADGMDLEETVSASFTGSFGDTAS